jgi:23S rRNA (cytidine1920-2'-O)/16S rRNA (cytidine1409-2'-O)-methyltransferase
VAKLSVVQLLRQKDPQLTKDQAVALVSCKNVYVNGELCSDFHAMYPKEATVEVIFPKFVSRGGFKLERALEAFELEVKGLVMLDAGSSTGGFTDCLLQRGAQAVHSVDVGFNLLDYKIRTDARVYVHEKQNIMALQKENLEPTPEAAVADLSFRSIKGAASHILELVNDTWLVALIKPQFEVPKWQENFFGVVEDEKLMRQTLTNVFLNLQEEGIGIYNAVKSPIKGHKGNTEFLALLKHGTAWDCNQFLSTCLG